MRLALRSTRTPAGPPPVIALPPAFMAFYALHQPGYLAYACVWLDPLAAQETVETAFGDLAMQWRDVVRRANPASHAWRMLTARVASAERAACHADEPQIRDAVILHDVLRYTVEDVAAVMGEDVGRITSLLRAARRRPTE